ncbi:MAG: helix-turn-helix domain-containing protein [Candidatus Puniceispirillaceae bacterium]
MTPTQKVENRPLVAVDGFKQIGSTLKDARLSHGLSVKDISEKLRISVDFLTKLESGAFNELPAPAYVIGFLRSYGRCVRLAPDLLVARYMAVTEGEGSKPNYKTPMSTRPPQRSAPAVASMLVLFALMAYGGWFWLKTNSLPVPNSVETDTKTAVLSPLSDHGGAAIGVASLDQPAKVDLVVDNTADTLDVFNAISSTEKTTKPSGPGLYTHKKQVTDKLAPELAPNDKTTLESEEIGSSVAQTRITGKAKTGLPVNEAQILSLPKTETSSGILPDELVKTQILTAPNSASLDLLNSNRAMAKLRDPAKEITIRAVAASWVEIVRDNGEEVMAKLMQAGDSYVVEGNTRLFLTTGNAGGLIVVIGTDDPLSMGDIGEIVRDLPLATDELRKSL